MSIAMTVCDMLHATDHGGKWPAPTVAAHDQRIEPAGAQPSSLIADGHTMTTATHDDEFESYLGVPVLVTLLTFDADGRPELLSGFIVEVDDETVTLGPTLRTVRRHEIVTHSATWV